MATPPPDRDNPQSPPEVPVEPGEPSSTPTNPTEAPVVQPDFDQPDVGPDEIPSYP